MFVSFYHSSRSDLRRDFNSKLHGGPLQDPLDPRLHKLHSSARPQARMDGKTYLNVRPFVQTLDPGVRVYAHPREHVNVRDAVLPAHEPFARARGEAQLEHAVQPLRLVRVPLLPVRDLLRRGVAEMVSWRDEHPVISK